MVDVGGVEKKVVVCGGRGELGLILVLVCCVPFSFFLDFIHSLWCSVVQAWLELKGVRDGGWGLMRPSSC